MRSVSVRAGPSTAAASGSDTTTELSPSSAMPPVEFDPSDTDSLATAFPSLAVITRRILNGMHEAMDRAIEDAARDAVQSQRREAKSDAAKEAQHEADVKAALVQLSNSESHAGSSKKAAPTSGSKAPAQTTGTGGTGNGTPAVPEPPVLGEAKGGGGDSVQVSRPSSGGTPVDAGPAFAPKAALSRDQAGTVLREVTRTVRETPRPEVEQVHRPENLAYSAMLLNG